MIAFDAAAKTAFAATDGSNQRTLSHTTGSGSNRGLIVFIRNNSNSDQLTGVTYNGVAMTQALKFHESVGNSAYVYIYYLAAPATGANNIVASFSGAQTVAMFSHSYTGVHQTSMSDATGSNENGSTTSLAVSVTTVNDLCWVATQVRDYSAGETASTNFTTRNTVVDGGISGDNNGPVNPGTAVSETVTGTSGVMTGVGISIRPATSGGIAYDATSTSVVNPGTSLTWAHTCTGSDRILFVGIEGGSSGDGDVITGVTYNSVSMTLVNKVDASVSGNRWFYLYYLIAPATGSNNIVVSASASIFIGAVAASYTGAKQSGVPDSSNTGGAASGTSLSISTTTVADNCWIVGYFCGAAQPTADSNTILRNTETTGNGCIGNYNGPTKTPAGAQATGITWTGSNGNGGIVASFAPLSATTNAAFLLNFV